MARKRQSFHRPRWNNPQKRKRERAKKRFRIFIGFLFLLLLAGIGYVAYILFQPIGKAEKEQYIYISEKTDAANLYQQLETKLQIHRPRLFRTLAYYAQLPQNIRQGKYALSAEDNVFELIEKLKTEEQVPIIPRMNYARTQPVLLKALTENLAMKTEELTKRLADPAYCAKLGFDTITIRCIFSPDLVQSLREQKPPLYWDIAPDSLIHYFKNGYDEFWTKKRKAKALSMGLKPEEIVTIASIVQEESAKEDEWPVIAGLYLNRLRKGYKLQADPTARYAYGDFTVQRIGRKQINCESPYNTYKIKGLPPGPITFPSYSAIESVLNFKEHRYIYMCAKPDFSGYHNFAYRYADHCRNAQAYQKELNRRNIN